MATTHHKRKHKLLSQDARRRLPKLYSQDGKGADAIAHVKFFCPYGRGTWYFTEFDGEDRLFGYCVSSLGPDCDEWGYSSLGEMDATEISLFGTKVPAIERDLYWTPKPVRECEGCERA